MATTLTQILTDVGHRLGYDSPESAVETRWIAYTNQVYFNVLRKHYWWFTEKTADFNSVANQEFYDSGDGFPSDIRGSAILELRYNNTLYTPITQDKAFSSLDSTYANAYNSYFIFNQSLYPIPRFSANGTDNVVMKYYYIPAKLTTGSDTIIIPDLYADVLASGVASKINRLDDMRGSAADDFEEYNEILKDMMTAQNEYLFALKSNDENEYHTDFL